jgi:Tol biopolymer transport system component
MAPEQAEGKPVDPRSDVFSMGVLLYEMATGERPFKGDTRISIISSILRDTPTSVTELNRTLPRHLGRIVKRCLAKEPNRRYSSARDLHNDLLELKEEIDSGELLAPPAAHQAAGKRTGFWIGLAAGAVIVAVAAVYILRSGPSPSANLAPSFRTSIARITDRGGVEMDPSVSPDGRTVVYNVLDGGDWDILLQRIEGGNVINLTADSDADDGWAAFSPDGERIAFNSDRDGDGIYLMGAMGGAVTRVTEEGHHPAWSADGREIYFDTESWFQARSRTGTSQLKAVNVDSGEIRVIYEGDAVDPAVSPNGHRIAFWGLPKGTGQRDIWTIAVEGGEPVPVTSDAATDWSPVWSPDGRSLYFISDRGGTFNIWRVAIDETTGEILGEMQPVTTGSDEIYDLSISADGRRILYEIPDLTNNVRRAEWNPDNARLTGSPEWVTRGSRMVFSVDLSPDLEWIAYYLVAAREDILVERLDGTGRRRLTDDTAKDRGPIWSPDGERIAFFSDRSGSYEIWTVRADGRDLRQLTDIPGIDVQDPIWSPGGDRLAFSTQWGYRILDPDRVWTEQEPEEIPAWDGDHGYFRVLGWSPDGTYLHGHYYSREGPEDVLGWRWEGYGLYAPETGKFETLIDKGSFEEDDSFDALWLSDNRRILVGYYRNIYLLDMKSRELRMVEDFDVEYFDLLRLSPDDRTLYWLETSFEADIWMLELE